MFLFLRFLFVLCNDTTDYDEHLSFLGWDISKVKKMHDLLSMKSVDVDDELDGTIVHLGKQLLVGQKESSS